MSIRILFVSLLAIAISACSSSGSGSGTLSLTGSNISSVTSIADSASSYADMAKSLAGSAGAFGSQGGVTKSGGGSSPLTASTYSCFGGGTLAYDSTSDTSGYSFSLTYNQCTYDLGGGSSLIMDGSASGSWSSTYDWTMSMPSFSFTVTGSQSFDMTISNYSMTSTATSASTYTLDYGMTIDASTLSGAFSIQTTTPLGYDENNANSYYGWYPISGTIHISANGTADITYYDGGFTITYSGGSIDCSGYICPAS